MLLWGDDDLEWMDVNEVRLERLVGTITTSCTVTSYRDGGTLLISSLRGPPVHRMGILLCEELEAQNSRPVLDLFDVETIEEYEWMWLSQVGEWTPGNLMVPASSTDMFSQYRSDVSVDTNNRRKLGKKDALVLYHQWAFPVTDTPSNLEFDVSGVVFPQLRALVASK